MLQIVYIYGHPVSKRQRIVSCFIFAAALYLYLRPGRPCPVGMVPVRSWAVSVRSWAVHVRSGAVPVRSLAVLVRSWAVPIRSWAAPVRSWAVSVRFGVVPVRRGTVPDRLGTADVAAKPYRVRADSAAGKKCRRPSNEYRHIDRN